MKPPSIEHIDFLRSAVVDTYTHELVGNALLVGKRLDGRTSIQPRKIHVEQLANPGNVIVSLGDTIVFVAVSSEIVPPNVEHPTEGIVTFSVELSPMCSLNYEPGKASDVEQEISYAIEKIYKDSGIIDVESLCIVSRKHVWCLRVNIHILQNDGNLLDATNIAVFKALMSYRKPDTQLNGDGMRLDLDANYSSTLK
uniref:3' exoribonuclease family, domain 1 containing protein n=1 Tax=Babesia bovis TaxID=5865 RepID=A7AUY6_BABBO|eukprot:XP_001609180.1 3' exoribonuclease family, domain 1 containing protein [Babesia bovis T2Bo]